MSWPFDPADGDYEGSRVKGKVCLPQQERYESVWSDPSDGQNHLRVTEAAQNVLLYDRPKNCEWNTIAISFKILCSYALVSGTCI